MLLFPVRWAPILPVIYARRSSGGETSSSETTSRDLEFESILSYKLTVDISRVPDLIAPSLT